MDELLILLLSKDSFTDYICNYLLMDGHYVEIVDDIEIARQMIQIRKYDLLLISIAKSLEQEMAISRHLQKIDPSLRRLCLFQLVTQKAEEISQYATTYTCPVKSFMLENLPLLLEKIQIDKIFEKFSPPNSLYCDRRKEIRAAAKIPVKYYFQDLHARLLQKEMISRGMDLSKEGIKLMVDDSTKILPYVNLNMLLPFSADPVTIQGEIKWSRAYLRFPWKDVGIKFYNIKNEDILKISNYINLFSRQYFIQ